MSALVLVKYNVQTQRLWMSVNINVHKTPALSHTMTIGFGFAGGVLARKLLWFVLQDPMEARSESHRKRTIPASLSSSWCSLVSELGKTTKLAKHCDVIAALPPHFFSRGIGNAKELPKTSKNGRKCYGLFGENKPQQHPYVSQYSRHRGLHANAAWHSSRDK